MGTLCLSMPFPEGIRVCHRLLCALAVAVLLPFADLSKQGLQGHHRTIHCFSSREITVISVMTLSYRRSENCASFTSLDFVPELRTAPTCMISFGITSDLIWGTELFSLLVVIADLHCSLSVPALCQELSVHPLI